MIIKLILLVSLKIYRIAILLPSLFMLNGSRFPEKPERFRRKAHRIPLPLNDVGQKKA